jgi:polysaccharide biosynthesis/export protein
MILQLFSALVKRVLFFSIMIAMISSCIPNKRLIYFPDKDLKTGYLKEIENKPPVYKLQPRDVLAINVKSADPKSANFYNLQSDGPMIAFNEGIGFLGGHSINESGFITLPQLGKIKLSGLTITEAQDILEEKLREFLLDATVLVKMVSFKVTVLGEVRNPGHFYIYNDQSTVLECLGRAGDLTDFGNRQNITLIRQNENGVGATILDLKDPKLLSSEYYFVQPNDVIYVQPMRQKSARGNIGTLNILGVIATVVSTGVLFFTFIANQN